jgi:hypothetical protein
MAFGKAAYRGDTPFATFGIILGLDPRIHGAAGVVDPRVKPEDDGREVSALWEFGVKG